MAASQGVTIAALSSDCAEIQQRIRLKCSPARNQKHDELIMGFDQGTLLGGKRVHFLDATEEEIEDLVRSLLIQLEIMAACLAMPPRQRNLLKATIASFEAHLDGRLSEH